MTDNISPTQSERTHAMTYRPPDPFLRRVDDDNRTAQAVADDVRASGNDELARQLEIDEAERTLDALEGHGLSL